MGEKMGGFEFWEKKLKGARLIVAPMVDQSELAWRMLSRRHGAELCYTPMFHASVFIRDTNYRKEALASCAEDRPLIVQFCANDPEVLLKAAKYAEGHCEAVDLNLGCPQSIAKRGHYGAFLQDEWPLIHKMVSTCAKELNVPITCKMRVFDDVERTVKYAQMLEQAGAQLLTVHGRTREQKGPKTGLASWSHIKAVRENVSVPVFANGNIQYLSDVDRCINETGVQGVMIAEGSLHNPALFTGIDHSVWDMALEYLDLTDVYPCPMSYIRGHIFKLAHHALLVHKDLRDKLGFCKTSAEVRQLIHDLKQQSQIDVDKFAADGVLPDAKLPKPYWICQPYVRPEPKAGDPEDKERRKRSFEVILGPDDQPLSRNKQKKLRRNPNKSFISRESTYDKCACGNIKATKCVFEVCRKCCRKFTIERNKGCEGHRFTVRKEKEKLTDVECGKGKEITSTEKAHNGTEENTDH